MVFVMELSAHELRESFRSLTLNLSNIVSRLTSLPLNMSPDWCYRLVCDRLCERPCVKGFKALRGDAYPVCLKSRLELSNDVDSFES